MLSILKDLNHYRSFLICFLLLNCNKEQQQLQKIKGYALGTSYSISYIASELNPEVLIQRVDSIFEILNNSLSTYIPLTSPRVTNTERAVLAGMFRVATSVCWARHLKEGGRCT